MWVILSEVERSGAKSKNLTCYTGRSCGVLRLRFAPLRMTHMGVGFVKE